MPQREDHHAFPGEEGEELPYGEGPGLKLVGPGEQHDAQLGQAEQVAGGPVHPHEIDEPTIMVPEGGVEAGKAQPLLWLA